MIEPRGRRDHDPARLGDLSKIAKMDERERRLPGNQDQLASLLERDIGGALDEG